jgi:hypothetical protein
VDLDASLYRPDYSDIALVKRVREIWMEELRLRSGVDVFIGQPWNQEKNNLNLRMSYFQYRRKINPWDFHKRYSFIIMDIIFYSIVESD